MIIDLAVQADISTHAKADMPRECCGLVIIFKGRQQYVPCRNMADGNDNFLLNPEDFSSAEDKGEVVAIVHSHPTLPPNPSSADRAGIEATKLPWFIYNPRTEESTMNMPTGIRPALYGRNFAHGVFDCYGFVQDYYREEHGIILPDFFRMPEWWNKGETLLLEDNLTKAGFVEVPVEKMKLYDGIIMQLNSPTPNHVGVLVEDNIIGHHVTNRLSSKDVYGHFWRTHTTKVVRHRSML